MRTRVHEVEVRAHLLRAFVLSGALLGAWLVVEKPRLRSLVGEKLTLARAEADMVEANALAAAALSVTPVRAEAQRQLDELHHWAGAAGDQASTYGTLRSLAGARGLMIERLEPGTARATVRMGRDARSAELAACTVDVVGMSDAVVLFICDLDSRFGAGKVQSFRMAPVPGVVTGRVRATIELVQVRLEPAVTNETPRGARP